MTNKVTRLLSDARQDTAKYKKELDRLNDALKENKQKPDSKEYMLLEIDTYKSHIKFVEKYVFRWRMLKRCPEAKDIMESEDIVNLIKRLTKGLQRCKEKVNELAQTLICKY